MASCGLPAGVGRAGLERLRRCGCRPRRSDRTLLTLLRVGFAEPRRSPAALVVSYTTVSPLPPCRSTTAVCSLWHCPAGHPGWVLPTTLPCGVRTFLDRAPRGAPRPPGRLVRRGTRVRARDDRLGQDGDVLVLLPPSEGKTAPARGRPLDLDRLSFPALGPPRREVLDALVTVAGGDRARALTVLGLSDRQGAEVERDADLPQAPTAAAGTVYTGVLYDALGLPGLGEPARRRAGRWLVDRLGPVRPGAPRRPDPGLPAVRRHLAPGSGVAGRALAAAGRRRRAGRGRSTGRAGPAVLGVRRPGARSPTTWPSAP